MMLLTGVDQEGPDDRRLNGLNGCTTLPPVIALDSYQLIAPSIKASIAIRQLSEQTAIRRLSDGYQTAIRQLSTQTAIRNATVANRGSYPKATTVAIPKLPRRLSTQTAIRNATMANRGSYIQKLPR